MDTELQNVSNKTMMEENGWSLNVSNHALFQGNTCGTPKFSGYKVGQSKGSVKAVFKGSGNVRLSFGNCGINSVTVYLNKTVLKIAKKHEKKVSISFEYKQGEVLILEEEGLGIILLYSLKLTCQGNKLKK